MNINIKNEKYETFTSKLKDGSVDFVCIDPPYVGYNNKGAVLGGHKIQTELSISNVMEEAFRITKDNSFFAFFGQMPTIVDWHIEAVKAGFVFKEDIAWVKRKSSNQFGEIIRQKELIYIYKKGKQKFYKTKGKFHDVKMPLMAHGLYDYDSYRKYIQTIFNKKSKVKINIEKTNDEIYKSKQTTSNRAPEKLNYTNVWSFLPMNKSSFGDGSNTKHPTVKPIILLERLIELCTAEPTKEYNPIVCDFFLGSGTTAI